MPTYGVCGRDEPIKTCVCDFIHAFPFGQPDQTEGPNDVIVGANCNADGTGNAAIIHRTAPIAVFPRRKPSCPYLTELFGQAQGGLAILALGVHSQFGRDISPFISFQSCKECTSQGRAKRGRSVADTIGKDAVFSVFSGRVDDLDTSVSDRRSKVDSEPGCLGQADDFRAARFDQSVNRIKRSIKAWES